MPIENPLLPVMAVGSFAIVLAGCSQEASAPEVASTGAPAAAVFESVSAAADETLQTYDETELGIPVTARHPDRVEVSAMGSGEGVGVFFRFRPKGDALDDAEVHVFLPSGSSSASDIESFVTGPGGLIERNGWTLGGSRADGATDFPYSWFETVFDVSTNIGQSGHVLLGQTAGQAIQVTALYPTGMEDEFWALARPIFESLEFDPSLLPVTTAED